MKLKSRMDKTLKCERERETKKQLLLPARYHEGFFLGRVQEGKGGGREAKSPGSVNSHHEKAGLYVLVLARALVVW